MTEPVDVIVVGMGPGGEEVAASLAGEGLEVLGVEGKLVGGECPYWGCIPSKMMIRAAGALAEARRVRALAGSAEVHPDWSPVARRIRDEATADWNDDAAVREALRTAADLVREEPMQGAGDVTRRLEVRATRGDTILNVSIHLSRER